MPRTRLGDSRLSARVGAFVLALLTPALAGCASGDLSAATAEPSGAFSPTNVFEGDYRVGGDFSRVLVEGPHAILPEEVLRLPSPLDGVEIEIGLIRPDMPEGERAPVILGASIYYAPFVPGRMHAERSGDTFIASLIENYVPHGYAVALMSVRGFGGSGGCIDAFGDRDRADLDAVLNWLGEQPWSNGNVGMVGLSADTMIMWAAAGTGNPHLKTIVPTAGTPDLFRLFVRNGTTSPGTPAIVPFVQAVNSVGRTVGPDRGEPRLLHDPARTVRIEAEANCPEHATWPASWESVATGERDANGFFAERDNRAAVLANYKGSVLHVHGFADHVQYPFATVPTVDALEAVGNPVKRMYGQWGHNDPDTLVGNLWGLENPTRRWDWAEIQLRWFERWLKEDATVDIGPAVQVADTTFRWRSEPAWPPRDASPTTWFLAPEGALSGEPPAPADVPLAPSPTWAVSAIPRDEIERACAAPACATFDLAPVADDVRFAGAPLLRFDATPRGPGGVVVAYLDVVAPDGTLQRVGGGILDLAFNDDDEKGSPVVAGSRLAARLQLEQADIVIPAGHALRLSIGQGSYGNGDYPGVSWFAPRGPNPPVTVHLGEGTALEVLSFAREPSAFFTPPGTTSASA